MPEINAAEVQVKLDVRERGRTDKFYLATEILGYDFVESVHKELFGLFIPYDKSKPWREQSSIHDRLILWPRGHFKSTAVIVEIIQAIINFPDIRILLMQGSVSTTQNLLAEIKAHFLGTAPRSKFSQIFPEHCTTKDEKGNTVQLNRLGTASKFTTPARVQKQLKEATVSVASPKAITTGMHFEIGFFDDLVNALNYNSAKKLKKTAEEFRAMIPLIDPGGYRIVSGTRYAHGDLYEQIIRADITSKQWTISVKKCWSEDGKEVRFPQTTLPDGRIIGFTFDQLLQIMREDPAMFASQYLNKPASSANQIFTEEKILGAVISEKDTPVLSQAVLFVDLAASEAEGADDSVVLCGKTDHLGSIYIADMVGGQWSPSGLAVQVIEMSLKHRPLRVMVEKTASATYFVTYLQVLCRDKGITLPIDYIKVNNTKDAKYIRIASLDGNLRNKRLRFFAGLPNFEKLVEQFVKFPGHRHDDYADTVALAVQTFGGQLGAVAPQTSSKHPILIMMEQQERRNAENSFIKPQQEFVPDSMGSDFE
jgi:predicted phage terminase large subunit-like protein